MTKSLSQMLTTRFWKYFRNGRVADISRPFVGVRLRCGHIDLRPYESRDP